MTIMLSLFLQSIIIGLSIAAPIGPVGVICIKTTISHRVLAGLAVGMGATVATAVYALIIGLGLASMTDFLTSIHSILKYGGGAFLFYLGLTFIFKKTSHEANEQHTNKKAVGKTFASALFLTLINPMTMLTFLGIMSAFEIQATNNKEVAALILGCLIGSALWWGFLVTAVHLTTKRINENFLNYINRVSGIIIIGFATYILIWT